MTSERIIAIDGETPRNGPRKWKILLMGMLVVGVILQIVPYGREHTNPSARTEPNWGSSATRALAVRACYDCHSNETTWPWYSHVAPVSWLVQRDVDEGRKALNLSEWAPSHPKMDELMEEIIEEIREKEMPPYIYQLMHPDAQLSESEVDALAKGFQALHPGRTPVTDERAESGLNPGLRRYDIGSAPK